MAARQAGDLADDEEAIARIQACHGISLAHVVDGDGARPDSGGGGRRDPAPNRTAREASLSRRLITAGPSRAIIGHVHAHRAVAGDAVISVVDASGSSAALSPAASSRGRSSCSRNATRRGTHCACRPGFSPP